MRVLSISIKNFGKLTNFDLNMEGGMTVLKKENGWGKSTLAAFVSAMFYSLPELRKKNIHENDRIKFDPWQGGFWGGSLTFEFEGKKYQIERNFNKPGDDFKLIDIETKREIEKLGKQKVTYKNVGDILFGVNKASYTRSAYIKQGDIVHNQIEGNLNEKLRNLVNATDGKHNYSDAVKILTKAKDQLQPSRSSGRIGQTVAKITELTQKIGECKAFAKKSEKARENLADKEEQLEDVEASLRALDKEKIPMEKVQDEMSAIAKKEEGVRELGEQKMHLQTVILKNNSLQREIELRTSQMKNDEFRRKQLMNQAERDQQEKMRQQSQINKLTQRKSPFGFFLLCVITIGIAFIVHKLKQGPRLADAANIHRNVTEITYRIQSVLDEISLLDSNMEIAQSQVDDMVKQIDLPSEKKLGIVEDQLTKEQVALKKMRTGLEDLIKKNKEQEKRIEADRKDLNKKRDKLIKDVAELGAKKLGYDQRAQDLEDYNSEIELLREQKREFENQLFLIEKTLFLLQGANDALAAEYLTPLVARTKKYISMFDTSKSEIVFDADSNILIKEEGSDRALDYFSTGNRELVGLCMRLGLVDILFAKGGKRPCIILDDPFVNLDEAKTGVAGKFLAELSSKFQVLYMTCHKSRVNAVA